MSRFENDSMDWAVSDEIVTIDMVGLDVNDRDAIYKMIMRAIRRLGWRYQPMQMVQAMREYAGNHTDGMDCLNTAMWIMAEGIEAQVLAYEPDVVIDEAPSTRAVGDWINYLNNITNDDVDVNLWMVMEIGEWAWAELVAQRQNDGSIHTQEPSGPDDTMMITRDMIDWATRYAQEHNLPDDYEPDMDVGYTNRHGQMVIGIEPVE